jgi:hypothetical protein
MTVTACLVTRNHDQSLGRAIRSVAGFASEVVVADTGSTDRTAAVAQELGAKVTAVKWDDDFAAAQNAALDAATGAWVFWLNPDEEVAAGGVPALAAAVAAPGTFAHRVRVRQVTSPTTPDRGVEDWDVRLFRRDPQVRFVGRLHPHFVTPLAPLAASKGQAVGSVEAVVLRHAYLSEPTPDKIRWVIRLIEAELRDRPNQLPLMIELGRNLLFLNDPRGHQVAADAAAVVKAQASSPVAPDPMVGMLLEYILNVPPGLSKCGIDRTEARVLAAKWFPDTPPVVWAVAGERFQAGDYAAAAGHLEHLVEMGRTGRFDPAGGFATDVLGPAALLNLGGAYLHLERWDEARACFVQLFADPNRKADALRGFALAEQQKKPGA